MLTSVSGSVSFGSMFRGFQRHFSVPAFHENVCDFQFSRALFGFGKKKKAEPVDPVEDLKKRATDGDVKAILEYAKKLQRGGGGVKIDVKEAAKFLKLGSDKGDVECMNAYAICLIEGVGVNQDFKEAFKLFTKCADKGQLEAQCYLGFCYKWGVGTDKDENLARKWYKESAERGWAEAQVIYAAYMNEDKNYSECARYYKMAADQNNTEGIRGYASCLFTGKGVTRDDVAGRDMIKKAAELGDANAQLSYAWMFMQGTHGVTKDMKEAVRFLRLSALQGNGEAMYNYGLALLKGDGGLQKDEKEAVRYITFSAKTGYPWAQYHYGSLCLEGQMGVKQDRDMGMKMLKEAADKDHVQSALVYAKELRKDNKDEEAFKYYKKLADQGVDRAMLNCIEMLIAGKGTKADKPAAQKYIDKLLDSTPDKAFECALVLLEVGDPDGMKTLKKIADGGFANAQREYANVLIAKENRTAAELQEAETYLKKGADQGDPSSIEQLVMSYFHGTFGSPNLDEALKYAKKATNNPTCQFIIGACVESQSGDMKEAMSWFKKSADSGVSFAQMMYGKNLLQGVGAPENEPEGFKYIKMAADQGLPDAEWSASLLLMEGIGCTKDYKQSVTYAQRATEKGNPGAMYILARAYAEGLGVDKDESKSMELLRKSADLGYEPAKETLKVMGK